MATMQGMSGVDIKAVVYELSGLLPLWVSKVYQVTPKNIIIRLNGENHAKYQMLIESGRRAHLVRTMPATPKLPPQFAMLLRKYIAGGKILSIHQPGIQRIIVMDIRKSDQVYHLVTELFDDGNIVLCNEDYSIIKPLRHHRFKDREVVPGVPYIFPPDDPTTFDPGHFSDFLKNEDRDIVRSLAIGAMFGGMYAEYICEKAGEEKSRPAREADAGKIFEIVTEIVTKAGGSAISPVITPAGCLPFPLDGEGSSDFASFNEALDSYYPPVVQVKPAGKKQTGPSSAEERIRNQQKTAIKNFERKIARYEKMVELIYGNYGLVNEIVTTLDSASKTRSWQEIDKILKNQTSGMATTITSVNPADASVEVDLGEKVTLFVHDNVEANAGRYYDLIKKFRKKIAGAKTAMEKKVVKKSKVVKRAPFLKKKWYHRFRWFITSDGILVLGGRDASQNEELVKKYMEGGDRFVHADVHGASVVIVKGTTGRMDEAAAFAASYSGAWRSGHFTADVYSVAPGQVSKTPESGEYVSRGSFIIRGEREYYRNVPLGIAIGLQVTPEVAVIGGPPAAVTLRTDTWVELKPGEFEPNDTARKVLRILRSKIPEDEQKGLKSMLNTENVAAFVPPGGSDILEP